MPRTTTPERRIAAADGRSALIGAVVQLTIGTSAFSNKSLAAVFWHRSA
jgi:hypothetical protein